MKPSTKRKITIFTGNRAEYGLQYPIIKAIAAHPELEYYLLVSRAHLQEDFGSNSNRPAANSKKNDLLARRFINERLHFYYEPQNNQSCSMFSFLKIFTLVFNCGHASAPRTNQTYRKTSNKKFGH